jgi:hypothetical protein
MAQQLVIAPEVLARVLAAIDQRADEIVQFAATLIQQPSVNPDLEPNEQAERPAQEWLRDRFAGFGSFDAVDFWEVEPNRPNLVAVRTGAGGGRSLILPNRPSNGRARAPSRARCAMAGCGGGAHPT